MPVTQKAPPPLKDALGNEFTLSFKDVNLDRTDTGSIILPRDMTLQEGIFWLTIKLTEQEARVAINERIEGFPIDVAHALGLACQELFGIRELRSTPGFWTDTPPTFITVPSDHLSGTTEVFIGRFAIPGADGYLETTRDYNDALWIVGQLKQKDVPTLRKLIAMTKQKLATHSLYKGKAIEVWMTSETSGYEERATMANPNFLDVTRAPAELMLNNDIEELLDASTWCPIERAEQCRALGIKLKRSALFYGPYGTGKSLGALTTAKIAERRGWTFIYLRNVRDLKRVYPIAVRYAPVVLFGEDVDLIIKHADDDENGDGLNMVNNLLDGLNMKTAEIMVILTTNHVERLPESLLRPGRFDAAIKFMLPDRATAARLVRQYAGRDLDVDNFDENEVGDTLAGNQPATIHEIVNRAKLFCLKRYDPDYRGQLSIATQDILLSAKSIAPHLQLLKTEAADPAAVKVASSLLRSFADGTDAVAEYMTTKVNGKEHVNA